MHSGDTDTLRVQRYVLPLRRTELSRSPMSQARAYPLVLMLLFVRLDTLHE